MDRSKWHQRFGPMTCSILQIKDVNLAESLSVSLSSSNPKVKGHEQTRFQIRDRTEAIDDGKKRQ